MFTTVMYGVINEVTRQPGNAKMALSAHRDHDKAQSMARARRRIRPLAAGSGRERPLPGTYRVLADSFKRAAGFH